MKYLSRRFMFPVAMIFFALGVGFADTGRRHRHRKTSGPLKITVVQWGPTQADVDAAKSRTEHAAAVQAILKGTTYRVVSFEYLDPQDDQRPPKRYRVTYYDYTNDRTYTADGDFAATEPIRISPADFQPAVSDEELQAAYALAASDSDFGPLFQSKKLEFSAAMPPVSVVDGRRYVNVGVRNAVTGEFRVVGVGFKNDTVLRYEGDAPKSSRAAPETCGIQNAVQETTTNGTAGQAMLTVSDGSGTLWEMLIVRPSASSGKSTERSGIEVRDVKYRGKMVMKRGHVPVLNVQYADDFCGPFRDWQFQEGMFDAPDAGATDTAPGVRILADGQVAKTSLETGNDVGNYRGVAVYRQTNEFGPEVVLVSEMEAGWYRYLMEWRFAADGTIRPRYGFSAVQDSCVCSVHTHHAYWRFDFDVVNSNNKVFQTERGRKFLVPIKTETKITRSYQTNRSIFVQNGSGDEAVSIVPNLTDGIADTFGSGDFWILKFQGTAAAPTEIDDPNTSEQINIDPFVNGESVDNQDVVVWYGASFIHNDGGADRLNPSRSPEVLSGSHVIGPDIRLIRW